MAAASRVFEIMDVKPEVNENEDAFELETVAGYVKFENVHFGYESNQRVLENINFEVKPGETVAILGATGSGKSSIINLIPRFYDITEGKITVDNHDIRDVTLASLRRNIAIVQQEPFIFSTNFKENIGYGKEDASMAEIFRVAKAAQLDDFISSLTHGYDTKVGERGVTLSGGQKQRVAIARALLTDPKIVIFDASTSSVDMETEHEIQEALESLLRDRTTFIITQRLSTVKHVDKIIVLDEGKIVEMGTHQELIAKKGWYYRLYQTQFQDPTDRKNRGALQEEA
jgi:ATP-binding cassette subfamily B protein